MFSNSRFVIFNADDFGFSPQVNEAVRLAHQKGVLTSASLMASEPGFTEAVEMARNLPLLGVGLHLVVTTDRALLPRKQIPDLVDKDGRFGRDPFRTGIKYAVSPRAQNQLRAEIAAQFARFAETGLAGTHVDGHQHFHLPPVVWDAVLENCVRYRIFRLRVPHEEIRSHLQTVPGAKLNLDTAASLIFRVLAKRNLRRLRSVEEKEGVRFFLCDRVYGHLQTGSLTALYTQGLLGRLGGKVNEIYFHPGAPHARLLPGAEQTASVRDVELDALLSPEVKTRLQTLDIQRGTYAQAEAWRNLQKNP